MRLLYLTAGTFLIVVGLISMISPIPGSTLFLAIGGGLIICSSERAERLIRKYRSRSRKLNAAMIWVEDRIGKHLSAPLLRTRPEEVRQTSADNDISSN